MATGFVHINVIPDPSSYQIGCSDNSFGLSKFRKMSFKSFVNV